MTIIEKYKHSQLVGFEIEDVAEGICGTLIFDMGEIHFCCDIEIPKDFSDLEDVLAYSVDENANVQDLIFDGKSYILQFILKTNRQYEIYFTPHEGGGFYGELDE